MNLNKKYFWLSSLMLIALTVCQPVSASYTHKHSTKADNWSVDSLERYQDPNTASIPITIRHDGQDTRYYIEVNNKPVSNVFTLTDGETLDIDVPVKIKRQQGGQVFKVCSVSLNESAGARVCSEVELFALF